MNKNEFFEAIKGRTVRPPEVHHCDTLDVDVTIKRMSGFEADSLQVAMLSDSGTVAPEKLVGNRARLIAACLIDDEGNPLTSSADIQKWDNDIIDELFKLCRSINKVGEKAVEEEVKD